MWSCGSSIRIWELNCPHRSNILESLGQEWHVAQGRLQAASIGYHLSEIVEMLCQRAAVNIWGPQSKCSIDDGHPLSTSLLHKEAMSSQPEEATISCTMRQSSL
jgi:hypothetical protein